ncbi:hypothetical protein [Paracoccus alkanivorans]|uniref:hypothetical protein n=1 Tax=Paracoccus alkanivorans TaxID=2116655 RepID=UPI00140B8C8E|nr:hypothetical protein [Paracoccus alkanivorans]
MQFLTKAFPALAVFGAGVVVVGSAITAGESADRNIWSPSGPVTRANPDAYK